MEIEIQLQVSNRSVLFNTDKYVKKMLYIKEEGWKKKSVSWSLFTTTYSFTKII